jgi:hypothetical protein
LQPPGAAPRPGDTGTPSPEPAAVPEYRTQHPDIPTETYRGSGRAEQGSVYNGPAVPILGPGRYAAFDPEVAKTYGPNVEQTPLALKNPLVIRSDQQWRDLTKQAGWQYPNPFGQPPEQIAAQTRALRDLVTSQGHDGVIVHWDDKAPGDMNAQGQSVKLLRSVFGDPQVVDYARPAKLSEGAGTAAPTMTTRVTMAELEKQLGRKPTVNEWRAANGQEPLTKIGRKTRGSGVVAEQDASALAKREPPVNITSEQRQTRAALYDTGTSPYRQVFRDAGLDPDAAVNLPIERQANIVKNQTQATYGLKNVTSDLSHIDTRDRLSTFYQNAQAMAHVQGMPPEGIGLDGRISLHLANDTGKGYLGAYMPGQRKITLVGGANSFAHEWMHAADHFLSEALMNNPKARALLSETQALRSATFQPGTPAEAFAKVVGMLYSKDPAQALETLRLQYLARHSDPNIAAKAGRELLARESQYARNSREFGQDHGGDEGAQYYYRPAEMIARAYEAYTADRVERSGLDTRGISKPDPAYSAEGRAAINEAFEKIYPKADERANIFQAFDQMQDALRSHDILAPGKDLAERPGTGDMVDPTKYHEMNPNAPPDQIRVWARNIKGLKTQMAENLGYDSSRPSATAGQSLMQRGKRALQMTFGSTGGTMRAIAESQTNERAKALVHSLTDMVSPAEGIRSTKEARGRTFGPVFEEAQRAAEHKNINAFANLLKSNNLSNMTKEQELQLNRFMQTGDSTGIAPNIVRVGGQVRYLMDAERNRLNALGIDIGYSKNGYFPHIYDTLRILQSKASRDAFEADARTAYGHAWDADNSIGGGVSRSDFAREAAADWRRRQFNGDPMAIDKLGASSSFTKGRVLPAAADAVLEKWRMNNPSEVLPNYFRATSRLAAMAERFGANGEKLDALWTAMDHAGVSGEDKKALEQLLNGITGQTKSGLPDPMTRAINMVHAVGTMALMPRALFTSLGEPMAALARTGGAEGVKVAANIFKNQIGDIFRTAGSKERAMLADTIGVTTNALYDSIISSRMGPMYDDAPAWGKVLTRYYARTGLTGLTNSQRRSTMAGGHIALTAWGKDLLTGNEQAKREAAAQFRDLGIGDADHATLANWLKSQDGALPEPKLFTGTSPPPEGAALWDQAITRFTDQVIQNPLRASAPLLASSNPIGRLMFGLMRFNYSFFHNIVNNTTERYSDRFKEAEGLGNKAIAGGQMVGNLGMAAGGIFAASLASTMVREAIFNPGKWEEMDGQGQLMDWLTGLAIQRTGLNGPLDPIMQAFTALRYDKSLTSITAGPQLGFFLQAAQDMAQPWTQGSPYTNTADFNALKGAYNMFAVPAETIGLTALPGGPLSGKLFGAAMMGLTSRGASERFAGMLAGEKGTTAPKPGEEGKLKGLGDELPGLGDQGTGPQKDAGVSGLPIGMLDDIAAPMVKYGAPIVQKLPGPLKLLGVGAGAVAAGSALADHLSRYTEPPSGKRLAQ